MFPAYLLRKYFPILEFLILKFLILEFLEFLITRYWMFVMNLKVLDVCDESDPDKYKSGLVTWPGSVNLPCSSIWMERSDFLLPFPSFGKFLVTDSIPDSSTGLGGSVLPSPLCVRAIGSVYLLVSSTRMERSVSPLPSPTCDGLPFSSTWFSSQT